MRYKVYEYRHIIAPQIKNWFIIRPDVNKIDEIPQIAIATSCPIIVVAYLVGELFGFTDELRVKIDRLTLFYNVDSVEIEEKQDA